MRGGSAVMTTWVTVDSRSWSIRYDFERGFAVCGCLIEADAGSLWI